jgi:hypothetical protein
MHCIDILWFREILANVFGCTVLNSSVCHQLHAPIAGFETETFAGFDTGTNSGLRYRHNADGAPALEHFDIFSVCFLTKPMHFFWLFQCIPKLHFTQVSLKLQGKRRSCLSITRISLEPNHNATIRFKPCLPASITASSVYWRCNPPEA